MKHSKTATVSLSSVVDTGEKFLTGVNDTSKACFACIKVDGETVKSLNNSVNIRKN
jgi:hypothetical protein